MRLNPDIKIHKLGKVYMIVDSCADNSDIATVYTMNPTAGWLWENIAGNEFSVESLVSLMCDTYDVDTDTATADIMKIIEKWRDLGLINP
ncbi:PqqD family protein [uncultured Duncaniella sp.]|jgi:hypothetical protein|uniref:PqqD family protein n=1 Tax=uncultured Duncaniella sp. TaxID=2768039 RepID=UPI002675657E|nr:PqqD family protein [uncultured Duncaniella sp.]